MVQMFGSAKYMEVNTVQLQYVEEAVRTKISLYHSGMNVQNAAKIITA